MSFSTVMRWPVWKTGLTVRGATYDEIDALPRMQVQAGQLFRELDMALVADGPVPEIAGFVHAQQAGRVLVAVDEELVVGFVCLDVLDGCLHVEQVTVVPDRGGQGIGRRLMLAAEEVAREQGYEWMTLTAFRDVPFNGPFYESLGWRVLSAAICLPVSLTCGGRRRRRASMPGRGSP